MKNMIRKNMKKTKMRLMFTILPKPEKQKDGEGEGR